MASLKRTVLSLFTVAASAALFLSCATALKAARPAPLDGQRCATLYPILLVHGISWRDDGPIGYWGRIPDDLSARGAKVYLANHDAWGSIEDNAALLAERIDGILAETGAAKVNIIAHSKGGLESRYLISSLGAGKKVASLTTINSPHRGAPFATILLEEIPILNDNTGLFMDLVSLFFLREGNPNVQWATRQLTAESMAAFNEKNPDDPGVYYQSWTSVIDKRYASPAYALLYSMTAERSGPNDGVVPVESAKWGNYRGLVGDDADNLVSHSDVTDLHAFSAPKHFDVLPFYADLAAELKDRGF